MVCLATGKELLARGKSGRRAAQVLYLLKRETNRQQMPIVADSFSGIGERGGLDLSTVCFYYLEVGSRPGVQGVRGGGRRVPQH